MFFVSQFKKDQTEHSIADLKDHVGSAGKVGLSWKFKPLICFVFYWSLFIDSFPTMNELHKMLCDLNFLRTSNTQRDKSCSGGSFSVLFFAVNTTTEAVIGTG